MTVNFKFGEIFDFGKFGVGMCNKTLCKGYCSFLLRRRFVVKWAPGSLTHVKFHLLHNWKWRDTLFLQHNNNSNFTNFSHQKQLHQKSSNYWPISTISDFQSISVLLHSGRKIFRKCLILPKCTSEASDLWQNYKHLNFRAKTAKIEFHKPLCRFFSQNSNMRSFSVDFKQCFENMCLLGWSRWKLIFILG